ncbi:hypothetical protein ABPG72_001647 [Tetrahymena utriculariae]
MYHQNQSNKNQLILRSFIAYIFINRCYTGNHFIKKFQQKLTFYKDQKINMYTSNSNLTFRHIKFSKFDVQSANSNQNVSLQKLNQKQFQRSQGNYQFFNQNEKFYKKSQNSFIDFLFFRIIN